MIASLSSRRRPSHAPVSICPNFRATRSRSEANRKHSPSESSISPPTCPLPVPPIHQLDPALAKTMVPAACGPEPRLIDPLARYRVIENLDFRRHEVDAGVLGRVRSHQPWRSILGVFSSPVRARRVYPSSRWFL